MRVKQRSTEAAFTRHAASSRSRGARGAGLYRQGALIAEAAPPAVEVIDSTGAGDSFVAALTLALIENQPLALALKFACATGALTTTKLGAQTSLPYRNEVEAALIQLAE